MLNEAINPLQDPRWEHFVASHPRASIFHDPRWLEALRRTYGFTPLVYTTANTSEPLRDGIVFCPIRSWITGKRLVSLPFSDHCDLLADSDKSCGDLIHRIENSLNRGFRYAEIRSTHSTETRLPEHWHPSTRFLHHSISLQPTPNELFRSFHKDCIQRKIRRAEREGLQYTSGHSEELLDSFYGLLLRTRRRHRLPPQPFRWFQTLLACMGDRATIHTALKGKKAVAAILTLKHQRTLTYKYGCADERYNSLGGMPFLFWLVIQHAKSDNIDTLDLGRSEADNQGLVHFKERLGARRSQLTYWTYTKGLASSPRRDGAIRFAHRFLPPAPEVLLRLPRSLLTLPSEILYKHMD